MKTPKRSLSAQSAIAGTEGDDHLVGTSGDDTLQGLGGNDTLEGLDGNDILDGGTGDDGMYGGLGDDIYYIDSAGDHAVEVAYEGFDSLYTTVSYSDPDGEIELFTVLDPTSTNALDITANRSDNEIRGNEGPNVLWAGIGDDVVYGFGGNDTLSAGDGVDILYGGSGNDYLIGGEGFDIMYGGTGNDVFDAVSARQYGDKNRMYGEAGNDTYFVDRSGDLVFEVQGQGFDVINTIFSYRLQTACEVEILQGTGPEVLELVGNELNNRLYGPATGAILRGLDGADLLAGGAGDDRLDGATGLDTASYAFAGAAVTVSLAMIEAQDTQGAGTDTLVDVENITGSAYGDALSGNSGANAIDGGAGADTMAGAGGDDLYVVDNAGDRVIEAAGGGTDGVTSAVTYTLGANVEHLTLAGSGAINGYGNALANALTGNAAANTLSGLDGNDTLSGGGGNDRLFGGRGNDTLSGGGGKDGFFFQSPLNPATNVDAILDFSAADDTIQLSRAIFTAAGPNGTLNPDAFHAGSAAADAEDRIVYNSSTGQLYYDADGSGAGAALLFATVAAGTPLTNADFVVYG